MYDKVYFPQELEPREQQLEAVNFCKKSINDGKKFLLLNIPTGGGKSFFVIMLANWYKNFINKDAKIDVITNNKILQDQYIRDFPFISNLKGRSNYYCDFHNVDCSEGKELNRILKRICYECPYDISKNNWIHNSLSITNFALFISLSLFTGSLEEKKSNLLFVDESHDLESIFCDHISTKLNGNILKKYGFKQSIIEHFEKKFKKIKDPEDFIEFIKNDFIIDIEKIIDHHVEQLSIENEKNIKNMYVKYIQYCNTQIEKFHKLIKTYEDNKDNWVLEISKTKNNITDLLLQPIWAYPYLNDVIWSHYDHVVFMSATILDKDMFSYLNGLNNELTSYIEMDSPFDIKNRPLYYIKSCGKMTYDNRVNTFNNQIKIIEKILKKYKNEKGIIHTVNYEITEWLKDKIKNDRFIFHNSENRDKMYEEFINSTDSKVMVSPSMMQGIDLKQDLARFSIIVKVPYPNISSKKIKKRQGLNRDWYEWKTCLDIIQCYGRTIRSEDDYSDTFILDESFSDILKYKSKYLPRYFTNAIKVLKS